MALAWIDLAGPIVGNSVYVGGKLVARDVTFTLPEVAFTTVEYDIGGKINLPVTGQTDSMECSITKIGFDSGLGELLKMERVEAEIRFVQDKTNANGIVSQTPCKAFLGIIPQSIPGLEVTMGERSENELSYIALRYRLLIDNKEILNIDKLARTFIVDGKDYSKNINSML